MSEKKTFAMTALRLMTGIFYIFKILLSNILISSNGEE